MTCQPQHLGHQPAPGRILGVRVQGNYWTPVIRGTTAPLLRTVPGSLWTSNADGFLLKALTGNTNQHTSLASMATNPPTLPGLSCAANLWPATGPFWGRPWRLPLALHVVTLR